MKVRIVSDGTADTTQVLVNGVPLKGVQSVHLDVSMDQPRTEALIRIRDVEVEASAEGTVSVPFLLGSRADRALRQSLESATRVALKVSTCKYRCCGGGWQERNYVCTYLGRVLAVDAEEVLLEIPNPLGKGAEVIAPLASLLSVELVD